MKTVGQIDTIKDFAQARIRNKVCIHVLREARNDFRAMRSATALVEAGFSVSIVDVATDRSLHTDVDIGGIHVKHLIIPEWFISRRFQPWFFLTALRTLILSVHKLLQSEVDIYHAIDLTTLTACFIVAKVRHKPLIFEAYELDLPVPETDIAFWRFLGRVIIRLLAIVLPRCAGVITVSPQIAQEMRKNLHLSEVSVVRSIPTYQTVQKSSRLQQHLGLIPDTRIVLYQGGLQRNRGLDNLVHAAAFLEPDIVIVLMGKPLGSTQAELETLIEKEGLEERVKILPAVPYIELLDWTSSADIGLIVLPPDYSPSIRWCLPNKLFEYLMAGLPVLASQLDAVVDVIKTYDVGCIVPSLQPQDIAAAINRMLADQVMLDRMRRNALEAAQLDLCWEKESQKLVGFYRSIGAR